MTAILDGLIATGQLLKQLPMKPVLLVIDLKSDSEATGSWLNFC